MSDPLRDNIPYFRTWLTITSSKVKGWDRSQASHVPEIEGKLESAKRCLAAAKNQKCADLMEEFADIVVQIQERLDTAKKKLELLQ